LILKDFKEGNSDDSGYDEYDEENSHIITEHSAPELVAKVEKEFKPVKRLQRLLHI
jgi:hypothetical protein